MSNQNQTVTILFGKGEYAITNRNLEKLNKAVDNYNATGKWQWSLSDCLGIKQDGSIGKRHGEILNSLGSSTDPKVVALLEGMRQAAANKPAAISHPTARHSAPVVDEKRRLEVKETLEYVNELAVAEGAKGFTEAEINRMVAAI